MSARDRILGRVRAAVGKREEVEHPGDFGGWRPGDGSQTPIDGFRTLFEAAGGEVVRVDDEAAAVDWLATFLASFDTAAAGARLPEPFVPTLSAAPPADADVGVSMAWGAVAETGSLVMDARDGRRAQLLVPTHVVFVRADRVVGQLGDALRGARDDLPSAVGLHSGPSKSADIGQIMVKGVHGPGRVIAVIVGR